MVTIEDAKFYFESMIKKIDHSIENCKRKPNSNLTELYNLRKKRSYYMIALESICSDGDNENELEV